MLPPPIQTDTDHVESHPMRKHRRWIIFWMVSTVGGFVCAGVFANDYFNTQFLRIGWERTAMMLIAEAVALFWFVRFLVLHGVLGRPLRVKKVEVGKAKKTWAWLAGTMLASAPLDCGVISGGRAARPDNR